MSTAESQSNPVHEAPEAAKADAAPEPTRRELLRMGGYAAAVAPAMLVLMNGKSHAKPACDSPAWAHGQTNAGHSGC